MFKILTSQKFEILCLSFVFLSRGLTQTTFALPGNMLYLKLLFIAIDKGVLKVSAAILIKAGGISCEVMLSFLKATSISPKDGFSIVAVIM